MSKVYTVLETIKDELASHPNVNTVTQGSIDDIDKLKRTMFPLSHIMIENATIENNIWRFSIIVSAMDRVDISKDETTDIFRGNDNEVDVLNTQLAVVNRLNEVLTRGANRKEYQIDGNVTATPFTMRFENYLAGWDATFDLLIPNDLTKC